MTDNVTLPATGMSVRTLGRGTANTQVVQLDIGGESAESLVSASNGIPVTMTNASLETGGNLATVATAQGSIVTGATLPSGSGILGWLSGIYQKLSGTLAVSGTFWQATQPVSIASMPTTPVTGTFFQTTQPVSAASLPLPALAATSTLQPALNGDGGALAHITNFPGTQPVSIASMPSTPVTGAFYQTTQPVSIASMPSTPVTGTFWQTTQPVSGSVSVSNLPATQAVSIASMPSTPVTGTFWQATQPISIAAALPAGANTIGSVTANAGTNLNTSALALETGGNLAAVATAQGTIQTGVTIPSGSGVLGWLSSTYKVLNSAVVSGLMQAQMFIGSTAVSNANPMPMIDAYQTPVVTSWPTSTFYGPNLTGNTSSSGTAGGVAGATVVFNTAGMDTIALTISPPSSGGTPTGGSIVFEVYDGNAWMPIKCARLSSYNTDSVFNLSGMVLTGWTVPVAGYPYFRFRLVTAITGTTGSVTVTAIVSSAPDTSVVTAGLDPLQSQHPGVLNQNVFQIVAVAATTAPSSLTATATNRVILTSTVDCWVNIGAAGVTAAVPTVTAASGSFFLPASCPSYPISVIGGTSKVAVIGATSAAGFLSILESV